MKYSIFALLLIINFTIFQTVNAQIVSGSETTINVEMIPENPSPNEAVYVSLTSFATDINSALITWKVNGRTIKTGVGAKSFTFNVGSMGTKTTLEIAIKTAEGETIQKNIILKPSEVDIIWQSKSFVPPFYKGKPLFSHQNEVTFIAIPHITNTNGQEISAKNLVYTWKKNGSVVEEASGFGKNTYTFVGPLISRAAQIEVEVYSPTVQGLAFGYTSIEPTETSVILYEKDPVYGIKFQKALINSVDLSNSKETTLVGMPFFFGTLKQDSFDLTYKWSINGVPIGNEPQETTQVFRQKEGVSGSSKISLSIENTNKILQFASTNFNLRFGE